MTALKWDKANRRQKRSISILDEKEWTGRDAAARWLARTAKFIAPATKRRARR
jgi:hypothetical protein